MINSLITCVHSSDCVYAGGFALGKMFGCFKDPCFCVFCRISKKKNQICFFWEGLVVATKHLRYLKCSQFYLYKLLPISLQDIFEKFRIGKLIKSTFAFSSTPELFFGLYLMYYFRVFERQIGSNKYSVRDSSAQFHLYDFSVPDKHNGW